MEVLYFLLALSLIVVGSILLIHGIVFVIGIFIGIIYELIQKIIGAVAQ